MCGKVVAIISSPRKNGNGVSIVGKMTEAAKANGNDVETFYINQVDAKGCQACMGCKKAGKCVRNDGLTPVLEAISKCDGIIVSTPDYFGQPCSQYRMFEDRLYGFVKPDFTTSIKPGVKFATVVTSGSGAGADNIVNGMNAVMTNFFKCENIGVINYSEAAGKGPAKDNADAMAQAEEIGKKF